MFCGFFFSTLNGDVHYVLFSRIIHIPHYRITASVLLFLFSRLPFFCSLSFFVIFFSSSTWMEIDAPPFQESVPFISSSAFLRTHASPFSGHLSAFATISLSPTVLFPFVVFCALLPFYHSIHICDFVPHLHILNVKHIYSIRRYRLLLRFLPCTKLSFCLGFPFFIVRLLVDTKY